MSDEGKQKKMASGRYLSTLRRVDYYMAMTLQGLLSDGDLTLNRINPAQLVNLAEKLCWEAMDRAATMADKIVEAGEQQE